MLKCLGILRETQYSPHRKTDDMLILKAVLAELERSGFTTRMIPPEDLDSEDIGAWDLVLPMCELYSRLKQLEAAQITEIVAARHKPLLINAPASILQCYRIRMVPTLQQHLPEHFPFSEIRSVQSEISIPPPDFPAREGWWIKRGDVHNTVDRDVVHIQDWEELSPILKDFESREITHFVIQPHLIGDLIKFYGAGPGRWFNWFYHAEDQVRRFSFDVEELEGIAALAATSLGLEVFGGDALVSEEGEITLLDLNSWPSCARVREEASRQIAEHLRSRLSALRLSRSSRPDSLRVLKRFQ